MTSRRRQMDGMAPRVGSLLTIAGLIFFFVFCVEAGDLEEGTDWWDMAQKIKAKILKDYDISALPNRDFNGTTNVTLYIYPRSIWLDDATQILTISSINIMIWRDNRLRWKPKEFGKMGYIRLSPQEIWKPDLTLLNNAEMKGFSHNASSFLLVNYYGIVFWPPAAEMKVDCPQDLTYWPYDRQTCHLSLASWTTNGFQLNLQLHGGKNASKVKLSMYHNKFHHWRVENVTMTRNVFKYDCCPETYVTLDVTAVLARNSPSFIFSVILPGLAIALLTLIQFSLAFDSSQKLALGCLASFLACLYVIFLAMSVPPLGTSCPIILKFFGQTLVLAVLSVALTCVVLKLSFLGISLSTTPPPPQLIVVLTSPLARVLLLQDVASKVKTSFGMEEEEQEGEEEEAEVAGDKVEAQQGADTKKPRHLDSWRLVAASLDRVIAFIYIVIFFVSAIVYVARLA
ncbi:neuronal acetylcholine receptor subunit alpha-9-like [Oratosquilla oratoria]|uniref:neuronal acetylcholine receptor subunit alpha-9-like n=1 Tax=Oratosquilla oratoria TaxID=337810 RepID=UPI003F763A5B